MSYCNVQFDHIIMNFRNFFASWFYDFNNTQLFKYHTSWCTFFKSLLAILASSYIEDGIRSLIVFRSSSFFSVSTFRKFFMLLKYTADFFWTALPSESLVLTLYTPCHIELRYILSGITICQVFLLSSKMSMLTMLSDSQPVAEPAVDLTWMGKGIICLLIKGVGPWIAVFDFFCRFSTHSTLHYDPVSRLSRFYTEELAFLL